MPPGAWLPQVSGWLGLNFIRVAACGAAWLLLCYRLSPRALEVMAAYLAKTMQPDARRAAASPTAAAVAVPQVRFLKV